jgi:hypothetical protein
MDGAGEHLEERSMQIKLAKVRKRCTISCSAGLLIHHQMYNLALLDWTTECGLSSRHDFKKQKNCKHVNDA